MNLNSDKVDILVSLFVSINTFVSCFSALLNTYHSPIKLSLSRRGVKCNLTLIAIGPEKILYEALYPIETF